MNDAKEGVKKFVSNEQVFDKISEVLLMVEDMKKDVETIKTIVGFRDKTIGMPDRKNHNTDPGPWNKNATA